MSTARIICGDVRAVLQTLPSESVRCVVTSPPYWGLRDYGLPPSVWGGQHDCAHEWGDLLPPKPGPGNKVCSPRSSLTNPDTHFETPRAKDSGAFCAKCGAWRGCLGLEPTYTLYVEHMGEVFADVHRVLAKDGTLWLNLGDCYATGAGAVGDCPGGGEQGARWAGSVSETRGGGRPAANGRGEAVTKRKAPRSGYEGKLAYIDPGIGPMTQPNRLPQPGLKPKDLVGIPWRVAFALQDDGWWLRSDCIWHKPNPMPESVTDRPTKAHEYLFLLAKSERYFYDADAIREPYNESSLGRYATPMQGTDRNDGQIGGARQPGGVWAPKNELISPNPLGRNKRTVWTITTQAFPEAHFATFPEALVEPCILAGSGRGDTVLDPFGGSGTVGVVALKHGRDAVLCELNPSYAQMARDRIHDDAPLFNRAEVA